MDEPMPMRLHMRTRPGMYIGGLNPRALRHVLDDVVCEQLAAPGALPERVRCTLGDDGTYTVEVRGGQVAALRPQDFDPDCFETDWEHGYFSLAVASAFSDRLDAEVARDGRRWTQSFAAGVPLAPAAFAATTAPPLVRVRYRPDPTLFKNGIRAGFLPVCGRAQEWAALHPQTRFTIDEEQTGQRRDFHYPAGLRSLAEEMSRDSLNSIWHCAAREDDGSSAEVAIIDRAGGGPAVVHSFVNGARTPGDGTHVDGLRSGVAAVAANFDEDAPANPFGYRGGRDPLAGFTVLLAVRLKEPTYVGATKSELESREARGLVRRMVVEQLRDEIVRAAAARC